MCFHQQDLGYKGFIANIIICEKSILTCDGIPRNISRNFPAPKMAMI